LDPKFSPVAVEDKLGRQRIRVRVRKRRRSRHLRRRAGAAILLVLGGLLVVSLLSLFPAAAARTHLLEAREALDRAQDALLEGGTGTALQAFDLARSELIKARDEVNHPAVRIVGWLPIAGRSPDATRAVVEAALRLAEAGRTVADAVIGLPGGLSALAPDDGRIDLATIRSIAGPLGRAHATLEDAGVLMAEAPTSFLLPPVRDAMEEFRPIVAEARRGSAVALSLSRILPAYLGEGGPRRYFVAAQNPAEMRGTGGLIGSYSILTVKDGRLDFADFRPVTELDTVPPQQVEPPNADYAAVWDQFSSRGYWSNINMTPDFPSAATAIVRLFEETEGVQLHGAVAADPFALASLLRVIGPVTVARDDILLNSRNAVDYLTNRAYSRLRGEDRKFILGDVAEKVLSVFIDGPVGEISEDPELRRDRDRGQPPPPVPGRRAPQGGTRSEGEGRGALNAGTASPRPEERGPRHRAPAIRGNRSAAAFGRALLDMAANGHLLLHSLEPAIQEEFSKMGVAGGLPRGEGDFLGIVANAGSGTKLDYYLERSVRYEVALDDGGSARGQASVVLHNEAPTHGQPLYVIGPHPFTRLEPGENYLYMSTYCAPSCYLRDVRRDGRPTGVAPHRELGHPVFQTTAQVPSGGAQELSFGWTVDRAWTGDASAGAYRLVVDGQPGVRPLHLSLDVRLPAGMHVASATTGMRVTADGVAWNGEIGDRKVFEVRFQRPLVGRVWHDFLDFLTQPVFTIE
jgi:uncharacterized protein DUF4012